ncbi:unnamed protein product [Allacma fusca]|uniref:Uncharacterized protein n=1 Tax=Allacma fusca TaxID=39272 RepID=A0A8J2L9M8_9HEXA|nr:unnamed protein product [Allacma fusca]
MQILGYAKALKEKIRICEEKINGGTNEMGMSSLQDMEILESRWNGDKDPKFFPGRILKAEMKLVATFKRPWQQVITEKDLFLGSMSFLPPTEYWKARLEDTPQAGPSEQFKQDISNEVNGQHFYPSPS